MLSVSLLDLLRNRFGTPTGLLRFLSAHRDVYMQFEGPRQSIRVDSVTQWHTWDDVSSASGYRRLSRAVAQGWRQTERGYTGFRAELQPLKNFGGSEVIENFDCEIEDVDGFFASTSNISRFTDMDEMATRDCAGLIAEMSEAKLRENLAHSEVRIMRADSDDFLVRFLWNGRLFLANLGGSHHFAAARYIAPRIGQRVPLRVKLQTYWINEASLRALLDEFDIFVLSGQADAIRAFHEAMRLFRATYLWRALPGRDPDRVRAILLPKSEPRSHRVASELRNAGAFDLGQHLLGLCGRQRLLQEGRETPLETSSV